MSYCRFSSDNWRSDVYVYEDVNGGFTTHVAATRRTWPIIPDAPLSIASGSLGRWAWQAWHRLHMWMVDKSPRQIIGGGYDGITFRNATASGCAYGLEMLRAAGYHVPQYAIDALFSEAKQELHNEH